MGAIGHIRVVHFHTEKAQALGLALAEGLVVTFLDCHFNLNEYQCRLFICCFTSQCSVKVCRTPGPTYSVC